MTVGELIERLSQYPQDMRVANPVLPCEELEIKISHYECDKPQTKEFDFIAIYQVEYLIGGNL